MPGANRFNKPAAFPKVDSDESELIYWETMITF